MTNKWNIINKNTITPKIAGILDLTIQIAGKNNKTKSISSAYSGQYHTVKPGQTLYDISMNYYGTSEMVDEIKDRNNIDDDYTIKEGQKILLP